MDNDLIKSSDGTKVYVIVNNQKKWIATLEESNKNNYKWENVRIVSAMELNAVPDYSTATITADLIKLSDNPMVYVIENGKKRWIKTAEDFNRLGYDWTKIASVNGNCGPAFSPMNR